MNPGISRSVVAVLVGGVALVAAVGATTATVAPDTDETAATSAAEAADTAAPAATTAATGSAAASGDWERVVPGGDCQCSDGSEFSFWSRRANPSKVVFMLEGGGACFDAESCQTDGTGDYSVDADPVENDPATFDGIFDLDNPANPFADYSFVFVPYCTGDVHIGNNIQEYAPDLTVNHVGIVNGTAAADYLAAQFPNATDVVVVGESAGAVASPLYGGLLSDRLPDADITVLADGSGGYPDQEGLNAFVGGLWGTMNAVPDWEVNEGMTVERWSLPGLWVQAGLHDPEITFARFDYAYDEVQVYFAGLVGVDAAGLVDFMDDNEERIETETGLDQWSYTAPGTLHTLVRADDFYTMEVNGVALTDWVSALIEGEPVEDVRCEECELAAADSSAPSVTSVATTG